MTGMALAVATLATLLSGRGPAAASGNVLGLLGVVIAIGCAVGAVSHPAAMTACPGCCRARSCVGLAAVLVSSPTTSRLRQASENWPNWVAPCPVPRRHGVHLGEASACCRRSHLHGLIVAFLSCAAR